MKPDAIWNVTEALHDRLVAALAASTVPGTVFVGPLDDPDASGARLILFLYRVVPSASLRNRDHAVVSDNPPPATLVYRNALPLDLHFLLTIGAAPGTSEEPMLTALGFAMQSLQADPDLNGSALAYETVHVSLEPLSCEEMSRIWALFPTANYRTSVAYVATPVWIDPRVPPAAGEPVLQDKLFAGAKPAEAATP